MELARQSHYVVARIHALHGPTPEFLGISFMPFSFHVVTPFKPLTIDFIR
jgi:hypothetical protein